MHIHLEVETEFRIETPLSLGISPEGTMTIGQAKLLRQQAASAEVSGAEARREWMGLMEQPMGILWDLDHGIFIYHCFFWREYIGTIRYININTNIDININIHNHKYEYKYKYKYRYKYKYKSVDIHIYIYVYMCTYVYV